MGVCVHLVVARRSDALVVARHWVGQRRTHAAVRQLDGARFSPAHAVEGVVVEPGDAARVCREARCADGPDDHVVAALLEAYGRDEYWWWFIAYW